MLDAVIKAVTNLAAIMLLGVILDLILPGETMRKYARFAAGLLIMLSMLTSITGFFNSETIDYSAAVMRVEVANIYSSAVMGTPKEETEKTLLRLAASQAEQAARQCGMDASADISISGGQLWVRLTERGSASGGSEDETVASVEGRSHADYVREYVARAMDIDSGNVVIEKGGD